MSQQAASEQIVPILRPVGTLDRTILRRCTPCFERGVITPHPLAMGPRRGGRLFRLWARLRSVFTGQYSPYRKFDPTKCPVCRAPSSPGEPLETLKIGAE